MHTTPEKLRKNSKEELNARTLDIKKTDWSTFLKKIPNSFVEYSAKEREIFTMDQNISEFYN